METSYYRQTCCSIIHVGFAVAAEYGVWSAEYF
jgi:hypothetical protein